MKTLWAKPAYPCSTSLSGCYPSQLKSQLIYKLIESSYLKSQNLQLVKGLAIDERGLPNGSALRVLPKAFPCFIYWRNEGIPPSLIYLRSFNWHVPLASLSLYVVFKQSQTILQWFAFYCSGFSISNFRVGLSSRILLALFPCQVSSGLPFPVCNKHFSVPTLAIFLLVSYLIYYFLYTC